MKRGTLILTIIAGMLVFLGVLVLYLPAAWFASLLPAPVRCTELGGSVWHGECVGLQVQELRLGDATWNLSPLRALTGKLVGDVDVRGPELSLRADLDIGFDGSGDVHNASGHFPMDPKFLPQLPRDQRGHITFSVERVTLKDRLPTGISGKGMLRLTDFRQIAPRPIALGAYEVNFDGVAQPNGAMVGRMKNLPGSPFGVEGTVTLTPPNGYYGEAMIVGHSSEAESIVREITFGAPPDASGRSRFTFEGTF